MGYFHQIFSSLSVCVYQANGNKKALAPEKHWDKSLSLLRYHPVWRIFARSAVYKHIRSFDNGKRIPSDTTEDPMPRSCRPRKPIQKRFPCCDHTSHSSLRRKFLYLLFLLIGFSMKLSVLYSPRKDLSRSEEKFFCEGDFSSRIPAMRNRCWALVVWHWPGLRI